MTRFLVCVVLVLVPSFVSAQQRGPSLSPGASIAANLTNLPAYVPWSPFGWKAPIEVQKVELYFAGCMTEYGKAQVQFVCYWVLQNSTRRTMALDVYTGGFGFNTEFDVAPKELLTLSAGARQEFRRSVELPAEPGCLNVSFFVSLRGKPLGSLRLLDYQYTCQ
jgi:hypothetical protein